MTESDFLKRTVKIAGFSCRTITAETRIGLPFARPWSIAMATKWCRRDGATCGQLESSADDRADVIALTNDRVKRGTLDVTAATVRPSLHLYVLRRFTHLERPAN